MADLNEIVAIATREAVAAALALAMPSIKAELIAAITSTPDRKQRLTLSEARKLLPGGVRTAKLLAALNNGGLRGELRAPPGGRPCWVVERVDLDRWDADGRPDSIKASAAIVRNIRELQTECAKLEESNPAAALPRHNESTGHSGRNA